MLLLSDRVAGVGGGTYVTLSLSLLRCWCAATEPIKVSDNGTRFSSSLRATAGTAATVTRPQPHDCICYYTTTSSSLLYPPLSFTICIMYIVVVVAIVKERLFRLSPENHETAID